MHRIGQRKQKTDQLLSSLVTQKKAREELSNRKYLKGTNMYVNDDTAKEEAKQRKRLIMARESIEKRESTQL